MSKTNKALEFSRHAAIDVGIHNIWTSSTYGISIAQYERHLVGLENMKVKVLYEVFVRFPMDCARATKRELMGAGNRITSRGLPLEPNSRR